MRIVYHRRRGSRCSCISLVNHTSASFRDRGIPNESIDTDDVETALGRDDARAQFVVIHDEFELEAMLNAPLEKWRVFLHPTQRKLVDRDFNGPVRVLGAAGTGKTVVAMHRARRLARAVGSGTILFVTFTRNLATDIRNNLGLICNEAEMRRIEVRTLDSWVTAYLSRRNYEFSIQYGEQKEAWRQALQLMPTDLDLPEEFYRVEWEKVIQANGITAESDYKSVSRIGRGTGLSRRDRIKAWRVFEEYRRQLAERGLMEVDEAYGAAAALIRNEGGAQGYSSVIVDEAQDIGPQAFRLVRAIVPEGANDLFITGDGHQAIYGRQVVLSRCGINIKGRSFKLKLNYRTTEQTRRWSSHLLEGRNIDDLDGGTDSNSGIRSLTKGPEPTVRNCRSAAEQADAIAEHLRSIKASGGQLRDTCVVTRVNKERDSVGGLLRARGLDVFTIEREGDDPQIGGVRIASMHRVKGLEFERVVIASMNARLVPLASVLSRAPDEVSRQAAETTERALVYVAASRAKQELLVTSYGEPSPLLAS